MAKDKLGDGGGVGYIGSLFMPAADGAGAYCILLGELFEIGDFLAGMHGVT